MKSKFILILCLVAICLISGCDKKEFSYDELFVDGRVIGSINGIVTDDATNARLANVLVTWVSNGGVYTTRTNNLGYYGIANLNPGYYEITFSDMEGYALGKITVEIETLDQIGIDNYPTTEDFYYTVNENIKLYRFNASLKGMVYASPSAELNVPAEGVTVVADFNGYSLADEEYTTVTDANGAYSFDGIPATANVDLRTMPYSTGGFDYSVATKNNVALITGGMADAGNIFLSVSPATPFLVSNNFMNDNFPLRSGLHMTFSKAMQTEGFEISLYETPTKAPADVDFTFSWTDDIVLVVDPVAALNANTSYTLSMTGMSQDGNSFNEDYEFWTQDGLLFTYSNLEISQGNFSDFPIDGTIELGFNMVVDLANTKSMVNLYHETDPGPPVVRDLIASTATLSTDLMSVMVDPDFDLEPDQTYYISYTLYSTIPGDFESGAITFTTSSVLVAPAQVTGFALDMSAGWTADLDTDEIDFIWNTVANAATYKIFARDNRGNTDFKEIASFDNEDNSTIQSGGIDLSGFTEFDWLADDSWQTPFANGTELTFSIVAVNSAGMGIFSTEIVIADETGDISVSVGTQEETADNTYGATARLVDIWAEGNEYINTTTPASWSIAGDTLGYTVQAGDISFEMDPDMLSGYFTITIPAGQNATGDTVYFFFNDGSGNISDTMMTVLTGTNFATTANIDYDQDGLTFSWTNYSSTYDDYNIYVSDNLFNTTPVMFGPDAGSPFLINLAGSDFDGDTAQVDQGILTPFLNAELTFTLIPLDYNGIELEPIGQMVLADTILPSGAGLAYVAGTANNASGDTLHYTIDLSGASEFLDSTSAVAGTMFSFIDGNGATDLPASAVSIAWDAGLMSGTIYIVVPDGEDHQLDTLQVTYFDWSGNEVETPLLIELTN